MTRPTNHLARGLTLIELVISMSIVVIVLAGITGAVMLAGQAVEANIVSADQSTDTAFGLSELRDDLTLATAIDDLSETGVTLTVPDRTGDGTDDTVIYTWESSGATLTRILNAEPKSIIAEYVQAFTLTPSVTFTTADDSNEPDAPPDPSTWGYFETLAGSVCPSVNYEGYVESLQVTPEWFIDVDMPADVDEGDLLIAVVATPHFQNEDPPNDITPPPGEGWTLLDLGSEEYGNLSKEYMTVGVWWKNAGASEVSPQTFTWTGWGRLGMAWVMHITGHDDVTPIRTMTIASGQSSSPVSPGLVTTADNALVIRIGAFAQSDITYGDTGIGDETTILMSGVTGNISGGATYFTQDTIGSVVDKAFALTGTQEYRCLTMEIVPCGTPAETTPDDDGAGSAALAYLDFTEAKAPSDVKTLDIPVPTTVEGDLLIATLAVDGSESPAADAGWTEILNTNSSGKVSYAVWWKLAEASEPATYTFTWSGNEQAYGTMLRFEGHDPAAPIETSDVNTGKSFNPSVPAVTTMHDGALILRIGAFEDNSVTVGDSGMVGYDTIHMDFSAVSASGCSNGAAWTLQSLAGGTGSTQFVLNANKQFVTATILIAPAPREVM
ncbi:MAG: prepilin-type N-terminal cleavage/methylation domain-containing protein [Phycisphaerales bacterium]|nr:prepilin-type N-terminal cleavage/methylation domain-containing protein [Phycisphaerales bacterium]